jgi:transcriptional regulator with XRE-family HTH domain
MDETLKEYLKKVRNDRGFTLRAVEEETGISNAYLSQLENGKIVRPSPSVLHKLAGCYDISYEHLMKVTGYPAVSPNQKTVMFRTSSGLEEITKEEEKELLEYLRFIRTRKRE